MLLAPAAKGPPPEPKRAVPERREAFEVSWYCVVVEVTLHDRFEPFASSRHGIVHARVELLLDLSQLGPHALADRLASHLTSIPTTYLPPSPRPSAISGSTVGCEGRRRDALRT